MSAAPAIRGWCPGAHRPMVSGDGLVVRVRPPLSTLSADQARGIAKLAESCGNGMVETTSRANLQIRGIREETHLALLDGLAALGLLDESAAAEARRNLVLDPFRPVRGSAGSDDQEWMAKALIAGLAAPDMPTLPAKFGFVVDAAPDFRRLVDVSGDIRIESAGAGLIIRADGAALGRAVADAREAVATALEMAGWFAASGGIGTDGRGRMRRHLAAGAKLPSQLSGEVTPNPASPRITPGIIKGGLCIGAEFGLLTAEALRFVADHAPTEIRVTPFRMLYLPEAGDIERLRSVPGLVTSADDPRLRVIACTGAPICPQAQIATRKIARRLAATVPEGALLHVSGCAKGCAHPGPAWRTLTGRGRRLDLIENGAPWDTPSRTGLAADDILHLRETS